MIGAVVGPLIAAALVYAGLDFKTVILWSIIPSAISVVSIAGFTRDRAVAPRPSRPPRPRTTGLPRELWLFVGGVLLFGLGDFSRTFLIYLAAIALGGERWYRRRDFDGGTALRRP